MAEEVGVEDPDCERDADTGEQPEPHDDREFRPAADLEVVWIGAMRSTRLRKPRYEMTCAITESVSMVGSPARRGSRRCVRVSMASPAIAPPIASEPVSPMKMRAGAAFHHRKPAHAPNIAAATTA